MTAPAIRAAAAVALALMSVAWLPLEWTTAQCGPQDSGQPFAAYGLPLPFRMFGGVSSMQFAFVPLLLLFDLAAMALLFWLLLVRVPLKGSAWHAAWILPLAASGAWPLFVMLATPVPALGSGTAIALSAFRPVGIGYRGYDCTPSPFWFPEHRR